ncbi:hypothetical protein Tco_0243214 [Tanacetum coccineum]
MCSFRSTLRFDQPAHVMVVTQNLNKFCEYHGGKGHNTNDCYQLKKQIEEVVASRKLARLVKDIRRNNQRNGNPGRNDEPIILEGIIEGNQVRRILVDRGRVIELIYDTATEPRCQHRQDSQDAGF